MSFDFTQLLEEVKKCETNFPQGEWAYTFGSDMLAFKIAKTLLPYMIEITPQSPSDLRAEMEFLYAQCVRFSPFRSMYSIAQGQFYLKTGQYDKAVTSFQRAYDIERDPTIKTWPYLQKTERNDMLVNYLRYAIYHSTSANPRPPEPR
jgi:tetratricopeptide (TPR) repeat protein